jgi:hypothetical protein
MEINSIYSSNIEKLAVLIISSNKYEGKKPICPVRKFFP